MRSWKMLAFAGALLAATEISSAQVMYAEVPFAFRAGATVLAPGTYQVRLSGPVQKSIILSNFETRRSVILLAAGLVEDSKDGADDGAALGFDCSVGRCALIRLWTRSQHSSLQFLRHSLGRDERTPVHPIRLTKEVSD